MSWITQLLLLILGSSWYSSVFLVVNAALGAGMLNFPAAYDQCGGLAVALTVQAVRISMFLFLALESETSQLGYSICCSPCQH